uniref:WG repeat-containing protein n=1 Tax=Roseihalotalea indica TaxID=2867963 RepID=A0AA49GLJ2_9BACT|nr:WG repeat-containing protein [Tunicatimonas sp. TK19036]
MHDQKWEKAELTLQKLRTNEKDSLFPDVYYAYSLLYTDTAYQHYQIDSAYAYILQASQDFQQTPEKEKEKLARAIQLTDSTLLIQKRQLDSLAFIRATELSTVPDYQYFIDQHTDAPQQKEAKQLRNALAFEAASELDTYQAYRNFLDTYPEAEQVPLAEERYNTLVFQSQTATGDLESYYQFLEAFPNSPYRPQAEEAIFQIITADNQLTHYARFVHDFPDSPYARKAVNWLYHLYKVNHPADSFFIQYPDIPYQDSLRTASTTAQRFLLPWLNHDQFGFMDANGQTVIAPQFSDVFPDYNCEGVVSEVIFASRDSVLHMLSKKGEILYASAIRGDGILQINELGGGLFWIGSDVSGEVVHISGDVVISASEQVDEVTLLPSPIAAVEPVQFIKFKKAGDWGLKSFTGVTLIPAEYDDIQEYNHFIVLERGGRLAVTNRRIVSNQVVEPSLSLNFQYEDVTLLDDDHLIAYTRNYESVIDTTLQSVVPLGRYTVLRKVDYGAQQQWLLKTSEEQQIVQNDSLITKRTVHYSLYPSTDGNSDINFSQAFYNDQWVALKTDQHYFLLDNQTATFPTDPYDSVKLISDHFAAIYHGSSQDLDSMDLLIAEQAPITFRFSKHPVQASDLQFRLIRTQNTQKNDQIEESLLIRQPNQAELLLNQSGDTVLETSLQSVSAYPHGLYVIEQRAKQGIIDQVGNELVPVQYDRIGSYHASGLLSIFHRQKFGAYHVETSTLIKPAYEAALQLYAIVIPDSIPQPLYIARKNGKYGIIDGQEQSYLPFSFQAVRYWNDTSALVQYEDQWLIYSFASEAQNRLSFDEEKAFYSAIEEFSLLPSTEPEVLIKIYKNGGYGVVSSQHGELLSPTFDDVLLMRNPENDAPIYLTEKYVSEAKLHILIHMNAQGEIIRREAYSPDEYDKLYCEQ